jgi:hypothetical protein
MMPKFLEDPLGSIAQPVMSAINGVTGSNMSGNPTGQEELLKMLQQKTAMDKAQKGMKKGGKVGSASKRADGIAMRGKTRGRLV